MFFNRTSRSGVRFLIKTFNLQSHLQLGLGFFNPSSSFLIAPPLNLQICFFWTCLSPQFKVTKMASKSKKPTRNWLELPSDLMVNILQRIEVADILLNAQNVCTAWREICKDHVMWRVVYIEGFPACSKREFVAYQEMCKLAVGRSQGQLLDLTIIDCCDPELLMYVADRSSQLRRLEIVCYYAASYDACSNSNAWKKLSLLEELSFVNATFLAKDIEAVSRYCPMLKTLKLNRDVFMLNGDEDGDFLTYDYEVALAIGKNLPELIHLELIGSSIKNNGLQAILDGCCHLESLDLRRCTFLDLKGDLGKRCSRQIKYLKRPNDSLEGCPHFGQVSNDSGEEYREHTDYDYE